MEDLKDDLTNLGVSKRFHWVDHDYFKLFRV